VIETAYLFQAVIIILWWIGISFSQSFSHAFQFPGIGHEVFSALVIPDIAAIVVLSIIRAYWKSRDLQLIILGAFLYATLFCVNATYVTFGGYFSTATMLLGLGFNFFLCYNDRMFRVADASDRANAIKTLIQIFCVWLLTLVLVPFLILKTFDTAVTPVLGPHVYAAVFIFLLCSVLGLWSSYVMVTIGKGTPLPLDQAKVLVTSGPYHYVRNPMALAGVGQGVAVSVLYMSLPILLYCLLGAIAWQLVVRPIEERDLLERFGVGYQDYSGRVWCWVPRRGSGAR
jgi:protein-S-isoprenylcysteine O-methyltransferase Ste14